jgi:hypothetical protein
MENGNGALDGSVVSDSHHIDKELDADPQPCWRRRYRPSALRICIRIRIPRIRMFLHFLDLDPDPFVRGMDPDPLVRGMYPYPSIIRHK